MRIYAKTRFSNRVFSPPDGPHFTPPEQMIKEYKLPPGVPFRYTTHHGAFDVRNEAAYIDDISFTLCTAGAAIVEIDLQTYELRQHSEMVLIPGAFVRLISTSPDFACTELICSQQLVFSMAQRPDPDFINYMRLNPVFNNASECSYRMSLAFYSLAEMIAESPDSQFAEEKMRHLVMLFWLTTREVTRDAWKDAANLQTDRQTSLFRQFVGLVHDNWASHHDVEWYAGQMAVTPRYLSQVCATKRVSPKTIIDEAIVMRAKEIIATADMSIQQVAARLGFSDQSVFARFFKRMTGMSPAAWRSSRR